MNFPSVLLLGFSLVSSSAVAGDGSASGNTYVKATVSSKPARLKAGSAGELRIMLSPVKGIHINLEPPVDVKLDSASLLIASVGPLDVPRLKDVPYLDPSKPVRQAFTLAKTVKPGVIALKGTLVYFYCSDAQGWCSRFKQPIDVKVTVVR